MRMNELFANWLGQQLASESSFEVELENGEREIRIVRTEVKDDKAKITFDDSSQIEITLRDPDA